MNFDKDTLLQYAPILIVVMGYFICYNIFVTPSALEERLDKFNSKIETTYSTKSEVSRQQKQLDDVLLKIDKIYDILVNEHI